MCQSVTIASKLVVLEQHDRGVPALDPGHRVGLPQQVAHHHQQHGLVVAQQQPGPGVVAVREGVALGFEVNPAADRRGSDPDDLGRTQLRDREAAPRDDLIELRGNFGADEHELVAEVVPALERPSVDLAADGVLGVPRRDDDVDAAIALQVSLSAKPGDRGDHVEAARLEQASHQI